MSEQDLKVQRGGDNSLNEEKEGMSSKHETVVDHKTMTPNSFSDRETRITYPAGMSVSEQRARKRESSIKYTSFLPRHRMN